LVQWYENDPAVVNVRLAFPLERLPTFAGVPLVPELKVTLCVAAAPSCVQVTDPPRVIVTDDGLNENEE
jgi:hypothetical protein